MAPTLSLLAPSRTSGAALPAVPGLRRPMVLHRVLVSVDMNANVSGVRIDASYHQHSVAQRGQSNRLVTIVPGFLDRVRIGATNRPITPLPRKDRAVVEGIRSVNGGFSVMASIATVGKITRVLTRLVDQERALPILSTAVGSDGLRGNAHGRVAAIRFSTGACHVTPLIQPNPLPGAVPLQPRRAGGTCTRIITVIYLDDYRDDFGPGIA